MERSAEVVWNAEDWRALFRDGGDGQEWRGHVDEWLQEKGIERSGENACGLFIRQER